MHSFFSRKILSPTEFRIAQGKFGNGDKMLNFIRADNYLHCNHTESVTCLYEY